MFTCLEKHQYVHNQINTTKNQVTNIYTILRLMYPVNQPINCIFPSLKHNLYELQLLQYRAYFQIQVLFLKHSKSISFISKCLFPTGQKPVPGHCPAWPYTIPDNLQWVKCPAINSNNIPTIFFTASNQLSSQQSLPQHSLLQPTYITFSSKDTNSLKMQRLS